MTPIVLVPLDGSDKDQRVLPVAAALARLTDGDLHLVRVLGLPPESLTPRARTMGAADAASEFRREMYHEVRTLADRLAGEAGRSVTAEVAEGLDVAEALIEIASRRDVVFVVMATRAPGAVSRALLGSVGDRVMRESPRPVVLVPPRVDTGADGRILMRRVLVPLDGSPLSSGVVDGLLALTRIRELELVLLEVVTAVVPPPLVPDPSAVQPFAPLFDVAEVHAQAERRLSDVAGRLRAAGARDVHLRVVEGADPAVAIARVAREELADFIAMSTRGTSGVERFVLGSVAEEVIRSSEIPVMLERPRGE